MMMTMIIMHTKGFFLDWWTTPHLMILKKRYVGDTSSGQLARYCHHHHLLKMTQHKHLHHQSVFQFLNLCHHLQLGSSILLTPPSVQTYPNLPLTSANGRRPPPESFNHQSQTTVWQRNRRVPPPPSQMITWSWTLPQGGTFCRFWLHPFHFIDMVKDLSWKSSTPTHHPPWLDLAVTYPPYPSYLPPTPPPLIFSICCPSLHTVFLIWLQNDNSI